MRNTIITLIALTGLVFGSTVLAQGDAAQRPVVVELFTSQGCSSCPPADAFLEELAADPGIVAITRPVTYWDRLGWKDTLARQENTELQRRYAAGGGEGTGVYTPLTMVQGRFGAVGSDRNLVRNQLAKARKLSRVAIAARPGLIAVAGEGALAEIRIVGLKSSRIVRIGSGENGGKVIRYTNIVVSEQVIGHWKGGPQTFQLPALKAPSADRYAVIVQSNTGPILAGQYL